MQRATVTANGIELAVTDEGSGPAIVLVHGFPELAYSWRHQIPALAAAGYRVIAYDQRGYGGSTAPDDASAYALSELVSDALGVLDALDIDTAAFVGHDWGSIVVWSAALMHPERVERVVSLNVPYRGWCSGFPRTDFIRDHLADRFGYVLGFQEPGVAEAAFGADPAGWLRGIYGALAADPGYLSDDEFGVYRAAFAERGITGPLGYYRNIDANADATEHLANAPITQPTLMVTADRDPILPPTLVEGMDRWVADLTVRGISDSGHWTQQEQPDQVNALLIDWLGRGRASA